MCLLSSHNFILLALFFRVPQRKQTMYKSSMTLAGFRNSSDPRFWWWRNCTLLVQYYCKVLLTALIRNLFFARNLVQKKEKNILTKTRNFPHFAHRYYYFYNNLSKIHESCRKSNVIHARDCFRHFLPFLAPNLKFQMKKRKNIFIFSKFFSKNGKFFGRRFKIGNSRKYGNFKMVEAKAWDSGYSAGLGYLSVSCFWRLYCYCFISFCLFSIFLS